jgi:hypothetical protein
MACLYRSDLSKNLTSVLDDDVGDSINIYNSLNSFIANSKNNVSGDGYLAAIEQLSQFKELFNLRKSVMTELSSAIKEVMSELNSFMDNDSMLDDGKLNDINNEIASCNNRIVSLSSKLDNAYKDNVSNRDTIKSINASISQAQNDLNILIMKKEKLEQLGPKVSEVYNMFKGRVDSILSEYESKINSITVLEKNITV